MKSEKQQGIGFFEKYSTVWVLLCMTVGILIGKFLLEKLYIRDKIFRLLILFGL